jgi:hypothetical protein
MLHPKLMTKLADSVFILLVVKVPVYRSVIVYEVY